MNKVSIAYLLWLGCLFTPPLAGLHRLYNGKIGTGMLWLFTWGLFGMGQFVDLFLIPNMVEEHNVEAKARLGLSSNGASLSPPAITMTLPVSASEVTPLTLPPAKRYDTRWHEVSESRRLNAAGAESVLDRLAIALVKAAYARGGKISATLAIIDTGASYAQVEAAMERMIKNGYVTVENHPLTGVVIYEFPELLTDSQERS